MLEVSMIADNANNSLMAPLLVLLQELDQWWRVAMAANIANSFLKAPLLVLLQALDQWWKLT